MSSTCLHPIIVGPMCGVCGIVIKETAMDEVNDNRFGAMGEIDSGTRLTSNDKSAHSHANLIDINMIGGMSVKLTREGATEVGKTTIKRLLQNRKLALVLDLDLTLLHATADVRAESLMIEKKDIVPLTLSKEGNRYFLKFRPYLRKFLNEASELFELSIYTHGTRSYAEEVASAIDPSGKMFSGRILSRTDCEGDAHGTKVLHRLFPGAGGSMVLILDDREDVWRGERSLIPIRPYKFFKNVKQIEGNFPGMKPGIINQTKTKSTSSSSIISDGGSDFYNKDENDNALLHVLEKLKSIHSKFYSSHETSLIDKLTGNRLPGKEEDLLNVCVRDIWQSLKLYMQDVEIVFSSVIPTNEKEPHKHPLWQMALSCGARVSKSITKNTTHLVAKRSGTAKVNKAAKIPGVWVLHSDWIYHSFYMYKRLPEHDFPVPGLENFKPREMDSSTKKLQRAAEDSMLLAMGGDDSSSTSDDEEENISVKELKLKKRKLEQLPSSSIIQKEFKKPKLGKDTLAVSDDDDTKNNTTITTNKNKNNMETGVLVELDDDWFACNMDESSSSEEEDEVDLIDGKDKIHNSSS